MQMQTVIKETIKFNCQKLEWKTCMSAHTTMEEIKIKYKIQEVKEPSNTGICKTFAKLNCTGILPKYKLLILFLHIPLGLPLYKCGIFEIFFYHCNLGAMVENTQNSLSSIKSNMNYLYNKFLYVRHILKVSQFPTTLYRQLSKY